MRQHDFVLVLDGRKKGFVRFEIIDYSGEDFAEDLNKPIIDACECIDKATCRRASVPVLCSTPSAFSSL